MKWKWYILWDPLPWRNRGCAIVVCNTKLQVIRYGFPEVSITKTLLLLQTEKTNFSSVLISFGFFEKIVDSSDRWQEETS